MALSTAQLGKTQEKSISLNAAFTAFVQVATKGIAFIVAIVIARAFGPDDYGAFAVALTLTTTIMAFSECGLEQQFVRKASMEPGSLTSALGDFLLIALPTTALLALAMPAAGKLLGYSPLIIELITALAVYWFFFRFHYPFIALMRVRFQANLTAVVQIVSILAQVLALTLIVTLSWSILTVAISQAVVAIATLLLWLVVARGTLRHTRYSWSSAKQFFRGAMHFAPQTISWIIYFNIGALILSFFEPEHEVGLFTAIFRLLFILYIVPEAFLASCSPVLYRSFIGDPDRYRELATFANKLMLLVAVTATALLAIGAQEIVALIYGKAFLAGLPILYWLLPGVLFRLASLGMLETLTTANRQKYRNRVLQIGLLLNIALNIWLIPLHGAVGAAMAATIAELIMLSAVVISCSRLRLPLLSWRRDLPVIAGFVALLAASHFTWRDIGSSQWLNILATGSLAGALLLTMLWRHRLLLRESVPHH